MLCYGRTFVILILLVPTLLFAQTLSEEEMREATKNLKLTAAAMLKAYNAQDFEASADYVLPKAIELYFGSRARLIESLRAAAAKLDSGNFVMISGSIRSVSKIEQVKGQLQSVVTQMVKTKIPNGTMVTVTSLLAISDDRGKTWYLLGIGKKKREDLLKVVPDLSPLVELPEPVQPMLSAD
jgi:hypothetical protein